MDFIYALPGAIAEGLIWGLAAIGIYIAFKILNIADLTVDGSIVTGGCVFAVLLNCGVSAYIAIFISFFAGAIAGMCTGLLHTLFGIPTILAGILIQLILYTINLCILGGKSLMNIDYRSNSLILHMSNNGMAILAGVIIVAISIVALWLFFYTEFGLTLKSTGDNEDMSRAQGVNVNFTKVFGLALSNGIVALAGALYSQYKGSVSLQDGRGAIVIGLAAIFIGLAVSLKIKPNFVVSLIGVVCGAIVYYIIYNLVIFMGIKTDYLKMLSAVIVIIFMATPYLKNKYFPKKIKKKAINNED